MNVEKGGMSWQRYGTLLVCLLALLLSALALGPIMRESDQASILTGALDIARGGDVVGNEAYRYDKFYGTYWQLALGFKLCGVEQHVGADELVWLGNALAFFMYGSALLLVGLFIRLRGCVLITFGLTLLSPVLLFSAPLVSPNIFSVALLLVLGVLFSFKESKVGLVGIVLLSMFAVASRLDAVLVMPALTLMGSSHGLLSLWKDRKVGAAFVGSVLALVLSRLVGAGHTAGIGEAFFFDPKITAAYLVFGLGAAFGLCVLLGLACFKKYGMRGTCLALAVFFPLFFYIGLLFTPRHLILVPVVVLLSCMLPRGQEIWESLFKHRGMRGLWSLVCLGGVSFLFLGIRLPSVSSPSVSVLTATRYPTADGYWPMGGSIKFLWDLGHTQQIPVDHNQAVWESWNEVDFENRPLVLKDRLFRYPELAAMIQGEQVCYAEDVGGAIFSERILRRKGTVHGSEMFRDELLTGLRGVTFDKTGELGIGRIVMDGHSGGLSIECMAGQLAEGNDVLLLRSDDPEFERKILPIRTHRAFFVQKVEMDAAKSSETQWKSEQVNLAEAELGEGWVVVDRLPSYMKEKNGK